MNSGEMRVAGFEAISESMLHNLKGGRAEVFESDNMPPQTGNGADMVCCITIGKKKKPSRQKSE